MHPIDRKAVRAHAAEVLKKRALTLTAVSVCVALLSNLLSQAALPLAAAAEKSAAPTLSGYLINLALIMLISPMTMGFYSLIVSCSRNEDAPAPWARVFSWYTDGKKLRASVLGQIWFLLLTVAWGFLYMFPCLIVMNTGVMMRSSFLLYLSMGGMLVLAVCAAARILTYFPGNYILADKPELPVIAAFRASALTMKPYRWELVKLLLGFIPLAIPLLALNVPAGIRHASEFYAQLAELYPEAVINVSLPAIGDTLYYISRVLAVIYGAVIMPVIHLNINGYFDRAYTLLRDSVEQSDKGDDPIE